MSQPALVIHGRNDHTCPFEKNSDFAISRLGSSTKRLIALDESFHVITVDSEKERVAQETIEFVAQFKRASEAVHATGA
jgi:carboxylesterase